LVEFVLSYNRTFGWMDEDTRKIVKMVVGYFCYPCQRDVAVMFEDGKVHMEKVNALVMAIRSVKKSGKGSGDLCIP
jgi:hypothetical protein